MSFLLSTMALCVAFSPVSVQNVCMDFEKVDSAQAILIDNEWYVALITEPIYTISERANLCQKISDKIYQKTNTKTNVIIDSGLYYDIILAKSSQSKELQNNIKRYFLRRIYEYHRIN